MATRRIASNFIVTGNGDIVSTKKPRELVRYACPCCGRKSLQKKFLPAGASPNYNELRSCGWCGSIYGHCVPDVSYSLVGKSFTKKKVSIENCRYFLFVVVSGNEYYLRSGWFDRRSRQLIKAYLFKHKK